MKLAVVLALAQMMAFPALAQDFDPFQGQFASENGGVTADVVGKGDGQYSVSLSTLVPITDAATGCAGGIDGEVEVAGGVGLLKVENESYNENAALSGATAPFCEISLQFSEDGVLVVKEQGGCSSFHGASCSFSGTLFHDAYGI